MKEQAFILEIIDTQGKSWQGRLKWVQGGKTQSFRSALELMNLLDSALQEETEGHRGREEEEPKDTGEEPQPEKEKKRRGRPRKKPEGAITGPGSGTV